MQAKPIDKTKKSNRRCVNCMHYPNRQPNPTHIGRPGWNSGAQYVCPEADNKPINYWNCCSKFEWNKDKIYK